MVALKRAIHIPDATPRIGSRNAVVALKQRFRRDAERMPD